MISVPFWRRRTAIAVAVAAGLGLAATASAFAQSRAALREECLAQYAYLRGPGQREVVAAHLRACIQAKVQALAHAAVTATTSSDAPLPLVESTPWLIGPSRGPALAKGVIYFVPGFTPEAISSEGYRLVPYYLKSLADDGWDVVLAKHPHAESGSFGFTSVGGAARTIRQRAVELKAQGYKRVVAAGHSWGGWAALLAARDGAPVDALLVSAPNTFGPRISPTTGRPNSDFRLVITEFGPVLGKIDIPTVLILPDDNVYDPDPAARGEIAEKLFVQSSVTHIVIAKPPGFFGHYAGWLPFFDYAYGACIRAFLAGPAAAAPCAPPPLADDDFRSIIATDQVADVDQKRISSAAPLVGRKFAAYTLQDMDNKHFDYVATGERVTMLSQDERRERVTFQNGLQCIGKTCSLLLRWSESEILEFDPKSGAIKAWWIEDK